MRKFITACAVIAIAISPIEAKAQSRTQLMGFNGIAFGTKLATVKKTLGSGVQVDHDKTTGAPLLGANAELYGLAMQVSYEFDKANRLTRATAFWGVARDNNGTDQEPLCKSTWNTVLSGLERDYGSPDSDQNDLNDPAIPSENVTFKFEDGRAVEAMIMGCAIIVTYEVELKKSR